MGATLPQPSPTLIWSLLSAHWQVFWLTPTLVTFPFSQWLSTAYSAYSCRYSSGFTPDSLL